MMIEILIVFLILIGLMILTFPMGIFISSLLIPLVPVIAVWAFVVQLTEER